MLKKCFSYLLLISAISSPLLAGCGCQASKPEPVTTLLLVRHGETQWNVENRAQGHSDIPLNEKGHLQASLAGDKFVPTNLGPIDAIYSSDLQRAERTAKIIAEKIGFTHEVTTLYNLREQNLGDAEGTTKEEREQIWGFVEESERWNYSPWPNGETRKELAHRLYNCLSDIMKKHKGETVLVTSHGAAIRCFATLLGVDLGHIPNCAIVELFYFHGPEHADKPFLFVDINRSVSEEINAMAIK